MAKICVPVRAKNMDSLKKILRKNEGKADYFEVWVDSLPAGTDPRQVVRLVGKPLIVVNKGKKENGGFKGSEEKRIGVLTEYAVAGAEFVDASADTPRRLLEKVFKAGGKRTKIILSFHDFKKTPSLEKLKKLRDKAFRAGAHIFKAAVFARTYEDNLIILRFLAESRRAGKPVIAHCMGEKGRVSRVLAPVFGSYIMYLAPDDKSATAPGQLTKAEFDKITSLLKL